MLNKEQIATVENAVLIGSTAWKKAFNSGDAGGCAAQYETTAVMNAKPFGTFTGSAAIQEFWQKLIDDGFTDVEYLEPKIKVLNETSAILTSGWKMNKAQGLIHRELWVLQKDGTAKLRNDDFEAI